MTLAPEARKSIPLDEALGSKMEEDRHSLQPGIDAFYITDVFISTETRYNKDPKTGEGKLAKINGVKDPNQIGLGNVVKYRTAAAAMVDQIEKLAARNAASNGHFRLPVGPVTVVNHLSENPGNNGEQVFYYKIVPAA